MKIEDISAETLGKVDDRELRNLRFRFIQLWEGTFSKKHGPEVADFLGHYRTLIDEMNRRGVPRLNVYGIDREVMKSALYGFSPQALEELVYIPDFVSIGGSYARSPKEANDIDLIIRQEGWDEGLVLKLNRALKAFFDQGLHFVYSPVGPHSSYIPVFDLVLRPKSGFEKVEVKEGRIAKDGEDRSVGPVDKASLTLGRAFTPLKSHGGYGEYEFADMDALWTTWAQGYVPEPGVAVEVKYDGFRVEIHRKGAEIKVFSEDAKRDLAERLPDVVKELGGYPGEFILDGELLVYLGDKKVERKDMPAYLMTKEPGPFKAVIECFDCLWRDGKPLNDEPWTERQKALAELFGKVDEKLVRRVQPSVARTQAEFRSAVKRCATVAHSEGAMCKVVNSKYPLDGHTQEWAKFKNFKSLAVRVTDKEAKEGGGWIYTCEIAQGIPIGRTYATSLEAKVGDVIEIAAAEVKYDEKEDRLTWDNPIPREVKASGTALTTKQQAIALSRLGRTAQKAESRLTYTAGDKGTGIAQVHIMGLDEKQVEELKKVGDRARVAAGDPVKLKTVLVGAIGNAGAHVDMRLRKGEANFWEGNEIFIGNLEGLPKLDKLKREGESLRSEWKVPHKDEPQGEAIQGPLGWMEAGARRPDIFQPGEPGATTNKYGAMIRIDKFTWAIYYAKEDGHAYKFHFDGGRYFDGNFLWAYVPMAEGRMWMVRRLADDDDKQPMEKREHDPGYIAETERINENKKKPEASKPHEFKAAKWTFPNGHPRCLVCGDEEAIGKVCNMPPEWYERREWDDEAGWAEERKKLRAEGVIKSDGPLSKDIEKSLEVFIFKEDQHIVGGIVYEPDVVDAQDDWASEDDIREAEYYFMENSQQFKIRHKGEPDPTIRILESYLAPADFKVNGRFIRKGSWYLTLRVNNEAVWQQVKEGKLTGFSLSGTAVEEA
jgi:hypothetical protein